MINRLKVLIDAHMVGERESGNERYVLNLIGALQALDLPADFLVAVTGPSAFDGVVTASQNWRLVPVSSSPGQRLLADLPRLAKQEKASVLHVTYAGPLRCACPIVSTVHDVSFLAHPEWFSFRDRVVLRCGVGATLSRGASILTVSNYSKAEICNYYRLPADRIQVTKEAADSRFRVLMPNESGVEHLLEMGIRVPYVLAVGNLQPRKNLTRLVESFVRLKKESHLPHQLVLAGKAQWKQSELFVAIRRAGIEKDVLVTGYITDDELVSLYNAADAFVYPSLYEGFGLPVLEAMACGVPVVTSRTTSIPEVAGDAALLVDPLDTRELARAIGRVLRDRPLHETLRAKGLRHAATFSWAKTARETWDCYCRVAAGGHP